MNVARAARHSRGRALPMSLIILFSVLHSFYRKTPGQLTMTGVGRRAFGHWLIVFAGLGAPLEFTNQPPTAEPVV